MVATKRPKKAKATQPPQAFPELTLPYEISTLTDYIEVKIDQDALDVYLTKYFECYPRRRKKPITKPFVPSLNKYLVMNKDARNELKQHWEDFMWTIVKTNGWNTLQLSKCHVDVWYVFGDKRKSDLDNRIFR